MGKPAKKVVNPDDHIKEVSIQHKKNMGFPIVAIGGSAGSFSAFEKFFQNMPADSGMSFVVIMHLDPIHKSQLSEVMQRYTSMPVTEASDGIIVEPDKVYIIPANTDMGIHNRKLLLLKASKPDGIRQPIDYFFQSLANDQWNRSIAIVLSGMGSDGETGVLMIKENLGLTIAQDPDTADFDSMPLAAIDTNLIDYVLHPEEMPLKIIQYLNHPVFAFEADDETRQAVRNNNSIQKILMLLRTHTGNDFTLYKKSTITRRIDRRIAFYQFPDYAQYVGYLKENPEEIDMLFNELLIGVTKFFRDKSAFESLKISIDGFVRQKSKTDPIRVWIAGCSTGEEAYSVAMLLIESVETIHPNSPPKIQVYATDLDTAALEHARIGFYHSNIVAEVSPERLKRFFINVEDRYQVKKELRDLVVFAQQNLIKDPPFIKLDLLCCRNILIYFTAELQKRLIPLFYYALNPKGVMFMGPAETIGGFTGMFQLVDHKWKIFSRLEGNMKLSNMIDFPFQVNRQISNIPKSDMIIPAVMKKPLSELFNKVLIDKFSSASVLVNEKGDILYNNGKTGRYLELPKGETDTNNVFKLAKEEFKYILTTSIDQALRQEETVITENIRLKDDVQTRLISIKAVAIREPETPVFVMVVFEENGVLKKTDKRKNPETTNDNTLADELKKELFYTKQLLNNTVDQMESSLDRLKLSNDELQSTNEELQSTNEESLTTKEEMQSLNEELMTVNAQYQSKAEELTRLNNDMKNLLDSTEICTIFLDNELNIVRFTPQARLLFNLIASDIGRPISHIASNFEQALNESDLKEVIDKLTVKVMDVRTKAHQWYRLRIMPYRTLDNYIAGAVLTLTLITDYKHMQSQLNVLQESFGSLISTMPGAVAQLDKDLKVVIANEQFLDLFNIKRKDLLGLKADDFIDKHWKTLVVGPLLSKSILENREVTTTFILKGEGGATYTISAQTIFAESDKPQLFVLKIYEPKGNIPI